MEQQKNIYTVESINRYIKNMFSADYFLKSLYVRGEISNCKYHTAGHIYFTLKDATGSIKCVMFAGNVRNGLRFRLTDGQQVVIRGSVDVYVQTGAYQLYAESIELDGRGALYEKFEQLKEELAELGMFDAMYKKPIPENARKIGVVTASTGAAIRDIINVSKRRNPYIEIILFPALVQGGEAAPSIVKGIETLDKAGVDLIIVGRGGGSMEDLWAFNERIVAQAIFDCETPIISAVGHEVDFTIADFVADKRAATPSAAAEIAVRELRETDELIESRKRQLDLSITNRIRREKEYLSSQKRQLMLLSPQAKLVRAKEKMLMYADKLDGAFEDILKDRKNKLALKASKLDGLSPLKRLESGYAYVADDSGKRINRASDLAVGNEVRLTFSDGSVKAEVRELI